MGSCEKFGRLYAYFLEVCRRFINKKLHEEMCVPKFGQEMYECLNRWLSDRFDQSYEEALRDSAFLSDEDRGYLSPENRIIEVEQFDISMHLKIIRLLEPCFGRRRWEYIAKVRNYLCHIPVEVLQRNMNQQEFNYQLNWLREDLEFAGIDRELLNSCESNILNGRQ